jgi:hypothetical protein
MSVIASQCTEEKVVAGMATMPSRAVTFRTALASVMPQVDCLYLYLDGHTDVPDAAKGDPRIVPILSRDIPDLHGRGKFLPLEIETGAFFYVGVDDDIRYPADYVASLRSGLRGHQERAVVGYHGTILTRPFVRYTRDRTVFHFAEKLVEQRVVDILGDGTAMFFTGALPFNFRSWRYVNMSSLHLAIEASRAKIPRICLQRGDGFLVALQENQPDSCFADLSRNDDRQTLLARELLAGETLG